MRHIKEVAIAVAVVTAISIMMMVTHTASYVRPTPHRQEQNL